MTDLQTIGARLSECKSVLIATHKSPDPDAVGTASGLGYLLQNVGVAVTIYDQDELPKHCAFLVDGIDWVSELPLPNQHTYDAIAIVDCNHPSRVGDDFTEFMATDTTTTIVLDHHIVDDPYGDLPFVDVTSAAAAEVVAMLAEENQWEIDSRCAQSLYAGLVADTGSYRHGNTNARVFRLAEKLVNAGAVPNTVTSSLFQSVPAAQIALTAKVLGTLRMGEKPADCEETWASVTLREDMVEGQDDLREDFVEFPRSIAGVGIAFQLKDRPAEGGTKISLRCGQNRNVQQIAAQFGGGGHIQAAGCFIAADADEAHRQIQAAVEAALWSQGSQS